MECLTKLFKALSDQTRLRIFYLLVKAGEELCICELIAALDIPQYNVSKHMKELKNAGLVNERKEGRFVFYSLRKCCDGFSESIFNAVKGAENKNLAEDLKRLKKRLPIRTCKACAAPKPEKKK